MDFLTSITALFTQLLWMPKIISGVHLRGLIMLQIQVVYVIKFPMEFYVHLGFYPIHSYLHHHVVPVFFSCLESREVSLRRVLTHFGRPLSLVMTYLNLL